MLELKKFGAAVRTAVTATALAAAPIAWSQGLPDFEFAPSGAGLTGSNVTADNIIISDYSHVVIAGDGSFTDEGYLAVEGFQLDGSAVVAGGLNTTYGMYFQFEGTGTQTMNNPFTTANTGTFDTLTFTLYGYNGPSATFGFDGSNNPTISGAAGAVALATGTLDSGAVGTVPVGGSYSPFASANMTFTINPAAAEFFASPEPFYGMVMAAFINTTSQVNVISPNEFTIFQGGGSVNFAAPIPEPETYALMLAGLGVVAFVARRRRPR
ncbi:MAG TPA: flocculation-associated PEP-CTERM protein PepA [Ilumatobacter sp.]